MLARLGWVVLIGIHLCPAAAVGRRIVESAGGTAGQWLSLLALTAAMGLFALKLADARFLRLPRSRAGRVAVLLAVALLHHDALGLTADRAATLAAPAAVLVAASAIATPDDLRRRLRQGWGRLHRAMTRLLAIVARDLLHALDAAGSVRFRHPVFATERLAAALPLRGPPVVG